MSPAAHGEMVVALLRSHHEPGTVVRIARTAYQWSQAELGRRCGFSASQVSRWETGRLPLRDVELLRKLAHVLSLPPGVFGLGDTTTRASPPIPGAGHRVGRVTIPLAEENNPVRRRAFLLTALTSSPFAWPFAANDPKVDPAQVLAGQLGDVLLGPVQAGEPAPVGVLFRALTVAQHEFTTCRYLPLASRLPALITAAEATATTQRDNPSAQRVLAESYNLATRALIKLEASGLEWISADCALHVARPCEHPLSAPR
ncbi:MAG TPA: helix-turn-helix transcriptional regulator [Pseudonocardiaceae bacterium]|nr:helix-turn-helix transcriptional regulator [Pseudonocardiaceae bacterium]